MVSAEIALYTVNINDKFIFSFSYLFSKIFLLRELNVS